MIATGEHLLKRTFDAPDEIRQVGTGKADVLRLGDVSMMRFSLPVGWKWSRHVKPLAKTPSCQARHAQYVVSGYIHVVMDDGSELDFGPGDVAFIPPGHDAWVLGLRPFVAIDVTAGEKWTQAVASSLATP
ncbi:MAG TPA: cupin domain-containing protein [Chloroflexota bacterium]|nr:cupin domain-containing protein [Chloroflexota bacterium]